MSSRFDQRELVDLQGIISRQGVVTIQTQIDVPELLNRGKVAQRDQGYHVHGVRHSMDDTVISISPYDLVYTMENAQKPIAFGGFANTAVPILSSLNGIYAIKNTYDNTNTYKYSEEEKLSRISEKIRFVGVALTPANPNPHDGRGTLTQVTTLTQGTVTLLNNGNAVIRCGDTLMWDIPTENDHNDKAKRYGHSEKKMTFKLVPRRSTRKVVQGSIKTNFDANIQPVKNTKIDEFTVELRIFVLSVIYQTLVASSSTANLPTWESFLSTYSAKFSTTDSTGTVVSKVLSAIKGNENISTEILELVLDVEEDFRRRIVGKALSYSRPGDPVDVFVCPP